MCTVFCHKREILYFSHEDCSLITCQFADPDEHGRCDDCQWQRNGRCGLTNIPLTDVDDGCCHWNVGTDPAPRIVTLDMVTTLTWNRKRPLAEILDEQDVEFEAGPEGIVINPDDLALPYVYGIGTDHD